MRIRADRAEFSMGARKGKRPVVVFGVDTAGVEHFNCVHEVDDRGEVGFAPCAFAQPVKRVRDADGRALRAEAGDGLGWRQAGRRSFCDEVGQQFALRGHDLLTHDDEAGRKVAQFERAAKGVVVGHGEAVNPLPFAGADDVRRAHQAIARGVGVGVELYGKHAGVEALCRGAGGQGRGEASLPCSPPPPLPCRYLANRYLSKNAITRRSYSSARSVSNSVWPRSGSNHSSFGSPAAAYRRWPESGGMAVSRPPCISSTGRGAISAMWLTGATASARNPARCSAKNWIRGANGNAGTPANSLTPVAISSCNE